MANSCFTMCALAKQWKQRWNYSKATIRYNFMNATKISLLFFQIWQFGAFRCFALQTAAHKQFSIINVMISRTRCHLLKIWCFCERVRSNWVCIICRTLQGFSLSLSFLSLLQDNSVLSFAAIFTRRHHIVEMHFCCCYFVTTSTFNSANKKTHICNVPNSPCQFKNHTFFNQFTILSADVIHFNFQWKFKKKTTLMNANQIMDWH